MCACTHTCGRQRTICRSQLSFHYWGPGKPTQVARFGGKYLDHWQYPEPSRQLFFRAFNMRRCWSLFRVFFAVTGMSIGLMHLSLFMCCVTLFICICWHILAHLEWNQLCDGYNLLMCYWVQLENILLPLSSSGKLGHSFCCCCYCCWTYFYFVWMFCLWAHCCEGQRKTSDPLEL